MAPFARLDLRVALAAAALAVFLLAFAVGRSTASSGPPAPELRPAQAGGERLDLPHLGDAAPLPALAAPAARPASRPAKRRPASKPRPKRASTKPVVIVGSG
jgi:hypothetical protein